MSEVGETRPARGDVWNGYEFVSPTRYEAQRRSGRCAPGGLPLPPLDGWRAATEQISDEFRKTLPPNCACVLPAQPETEAEPPVYEAYPPLTDMYTDVDHEGPREEPLEWRKDPDPINPVRMPLDQLQPQWHAVEPGLRFESRYASPPLLEMDPIAILIEGLLRQVEAQAAGTFVRGLRAGLEHTPTRAAKAWREWTAGYAMNPAEVLKTTGGAYGFEDGADGCDEMVVVEGIPLYSHCEHHLAPIFGTATIAYLPDRKIVGLSKLPRLVEVFARRLQVQERMTNQIANAIMEHLQPKGCGVVIKARHLCMESRGVRLAGTHTTTSALRGLFKDDRAVRNEFLELARNGGKR